jgi:hypothetical protein
MFGEMPEILRQAQTFGGGSYDYVGAADPAVRWVSEVMRIAHDRVSEKISGSGELANSIKQLMECRSYTLAEYFDKGIREAKKRRAEAAAGPTACTGTAFS